MEFHYVDGRHVKDDASKKSEELSGRRGISVALVYA
jgi:hypothetical protein